MAELFSSTSLFAIVLTLAAYELGCFCQRRTGLAVCNPILLGAVGVAATLGALGIPGEMYQQGTLASLLGIGALCRAFGLNAVLTASLLPKSITTAMGIVVSEAGGGDAAITTAAIIATGILGSVAGPALCRLLRLTHPAAQGAAFGTAAHVIGTSKAAELGETAEAAGSLALVVAGVLTAVLCPLL